jgi:hypothetical protein
VSRTEPELVAVRRLVTDLAGEAAEPSAESVARTWSRIAAAQRDPHRLGARWLWLAVPVAAAAVVAAAVVVPIALNPAPAPPVDIGQPGPPSSNPRSDKLPTPRPSNSPKPTVAVLDLGTVGAAVPVGQVVDAMVAKSAAVVPLTFGSGQLLYVRDDQVHPPKHGDGLVGEVHQLWINPDRMVVVKNLIDGDDYGGGDPPTGPPDLDSPTPAWLDAMSTDPAVLYQQFLAMNQGIKLSADRYVMTDWTQDMLYYGPLLSPKVRSAWFRMLSRIDGLTANQYTVGGKTYLAVGDRDSNPGPTPAPDRELTTGKALLDPATGQVVGELYPGQLVELWSYAVVDHSGQTG